MIILKKQIEETSDSDSISDDDTVINYYNMRNYMPFFGLNNVEFERFHQGVGNHAARVIQRAYRAHKSSTAEPLDEIEYIEPPEELFARELDFQQMDAETCEDSSQC